MVMVFVFFLIGGGIGGGGGSSIIDTCEVGVSYYYKYRLEDKI